MKDNERNLMAVYKMYEAGQLQQNKYFASNIDLLLDVIKPKRIIEIGTARGGATLLISDAVKALGLDTKIKSFDVTTKGPHLHMVMDNVEFIVDNIFNEDWSKLIKPKEIENFLSDDGVNLILCDGGNKKEEFKLLAKYLKPGDIIMAHDYAPNRKEFDKDYLDKIWNWMEITDDHIKETCIKHDLKPYLPKTIKPFAWVAKIK